jgi:deoxyxylulose-5-phosphate synthase
MILALGSHHLGLATRPVNVVLHQVAATSSRQLICFVLVQIGKMRVRRSGSDVCLIGYGTPTNDCLAAAETLQQVGQGSARGIASTAHGNSCTRYHCTQQQLQAVNAA